MIRDLCASGSLLATRAFPVKDKRMAEELSHADGLASVRRPWSKNARRRL
jgi:hypothetical protein